MVVRGLRLWGLVLPVVAVLVLARGSAGCLRCPRGLRDALEDLREDHVPERASGEEARRATVTLDELIQTYSRFSFMAQYVLDRVTIDLRRQIMSIIKQKLKEHVLTAAIQIFSHRAHEMIMKEMKHFSDNVECSNRCGNFTLKFVRCADCRPEFVSCVMRIDCGVTEVTVGEGDELLLDCFRPWHRITSNFKAYVFSNAPLGSRSVWQFQKITETQESGLEFLRVTKEHEKTYQCVVMGNEGKSIAEFLYDVHVGAPISIPVEAGVTHPPLVTEEGLIPPSEVSRELVLNLGSLLAMVMFGVGLLALGGLLCYSMAACQKEPSADRMKGRTELIQ